MIELNRPQQLGRKAFLIMTARKLSAGLSILFVAFVLLSMKDSISSFMSAWVKGSRAGSEATILALNGWLDNVTLGAFLLSALLILISVAISRLEYTHYTFTFEDYGFKFRRGILHIIEISIPYRQMLDVTVERRLINQLTGTSRVLIDSLGQGESDKFAEKDVILQPLDKVMAEEVRLLLQNKIGVQAVDKHALVK